jgi:hypothetical protein
LPPIGNRLTLDLTRFRGSMREMVRGILSPRREKLFQRRDGMEAAWFVCVVKPFECGMGSAECGIAGWQPAGNTSGMRDNFKGRRHSPVANRRYSRLSVGAKPVGGHSVALLAASDKFRSGLDRDWRSGAGAVKPGQSGSNQMRKAGANLRVFV